MTRLFILFSNLPEFLSSDTRLVLNQSKVFLGKLLGHKPSGGAAEVFLLSLIDENIYPVVKSVEKKKEGDRFIFDELECEIIGKMKIPLK